MKKVSKILLVLILVLLTAGCSFKGNTIKKTSPAAPILDQDTKKIETQTKNTLQEVKSKAIAWKSDAQLVSYNMKVPGDYRPESVVETYVFGSNSEPDYWWTYSVDVQKKSVRALVHKEDYLGRELKPIQEQYWKITYVDALREAENGGGIDFRAKYSGAETTITLKHDKPNGWLWYVVEYISSSDSKIIKVNANDGKIYDEQGKAVSTPSKNTETGTKKETK